MSSGKIGYWIELAVTVINKDFYLTNFNFIVGEDLFYKEKYIDFQYPITVDKIYLRKDTSNISISYGYIRLWKTPVSAMQLIKDSGNYIFSQPTNMLLMNWDFRINKSSYLSVYDSLKEYSTYTLNFLSTGYELDDSISIQCGQTSILDTTSAYPICRKKLYFKSPGDNQKITISAPPGILLQNKLTLVNTYTWEMWLMFDTLFSTSVNFIEPRTGSTITFSISNTNVKYFGQTGVEYCNIASNLNRSWFYFGISFNSDFNNKFNCFVELNNSLILISNSSATTVTTGIVKINLYNFNIEYL